MADFLASFLAVINNLRISLRDALFNKALSSATSSASSSDSSSSDSDSSISSSSELDAGQPWPPDVCAASREKYTHASCSSNTTYSTSGHGKGSFQFQVCPSTESQETFGN